MEWEYRSNKVTHLETGLTVHVEEGTFHEPRRINIFGDNDLEPVLTSRLVRAGIAFGKTQECSPESWAEAVPGLRNDHREKPKPTVIIKNRRRIPGKSRPLGKKRASKAVTNL